MSNKTGFIYLVSRYWWFFLSFSIIMSLLAFFISTELPTKYETSAKIMVAASPDSSQFDTNNTISTDRALKTVSVLATSSPVLKILSADLDIPIKTLSKNLVAKGIDGTQILEISYTDKDRDKALQVTKTIQGVLETYIKSIQINVEAKNLISTSSVEVSDSPVVKKISKLQITILGFLLALLLSYLLIYFLEYFDNSVRDRKDLEDLEIKYLGSFGFLRKFGGNLNAINDKANLLVAEMLGKIRANITFSEDSDDRLIVVSSSNKKEGNSTFCANLAIAISQTEKKTILIDADLRSPMIHRLFRINRQPGLTSYLLGKSPLDEIIKKTSYPNLFVIAAGNPISNPSDILATDKLLLLKKELAKEYQAEYVIFDTPPIGQLADAAIITQIADGIILTVEQDNTSVRDLDNSRSSLIKVGGKILGAVLTKSKSPNRD